MNPPNYRAQPACENCLHLVRGQVQGENVAACGATARLHRFIANRGEPLTLQVARMFVLPALSGVCDDHKWNLRPLDAATPGHAISV